VSLEIDYTLPGKWLGQVVERNNQQQVVDNLATLKKQVEALVAEPV
jgi:hypothetical protein